MSQLLSSPETPTPCGGSVYSLPPEFWPKDPVIAPQGLVQHPPPAPPQHGKPYKSILTSVDTLGTEPASAYDPSEAPDDEPAPPSPPIQALAPIGISPLALFEPMPTH